MMNTKSAAHCYDRGMMITDAIVRNNVQCTQIRVIDSASLIGLYIRGTNEYTLDKVSSIPLICHDCSDLGSLIVNQVI